MGEGGVGLSPVEAERGLGLARERVKLMRHVLEAIPQGALKAAAEFPGDAFDLD
jgi:hypothetical protein